MRGTAHFRVPLAKGMALEPNFVRGSRVWRCLYTRLTFPKGEERFRLESAIVKVGMTKVRGFSALPTASGDVIPILTFQSSESAVGYEVLVKMSKRGQDR